MPFCVVTATERNMQHFSGLYRLAKYHEVDSVSSRISQYPATLGS